MRYTKQTIGTLQNCYSLAEIQVGAERRLLVASEKEYPCYLFAGDGAYLETVWDGPGGVMTMVPLEDRPGTFLATHRFYSPNNSAEALLVCAAREAAGQWKVSKLADLPFVHRFDVIRRGGADHVIACTLKSGHEYKNDWRYPGKVYVGTLTDKPDQPLRLRPLREGMTHNHGYTRYEENGVISGIVSCDEGVYRFTPPETADGTWSVEKLLDAPCSDAVLKDLNGDGVPELITISPFHGDTLSIWEQRDGVWREAYRFPEKLPFLHAICAGDVYGRPTVYVGCREGDRLLLGLYCEAGTYRWEQVDSGCGSANCMLFARDGHPALLSANREINEIAVYDIER